ncbi:MAG: LysM peptidoglycan-binding domain-containing protein [Gammaproteobacteria bacterium]|nr:LysM peptidoglycan-binding domain-containing protein [Gammaproteobacteria bacterium]
MITTQTVQTAATAGMFLAALFFAANLMLASGQVLRGKSSVSELPTRLIGVAVALAIAFAAWPYARTLTLNTIGKDAGAMVQALNGLGRLSEGIDSVTVGSDIGLDTSDFSGQQWGSVSAAIMDALNAPEPEPWAEPQQSTAVDVFKPIEVNGAVAAGEMSVNDPNLAPTFPAPTPTPIVAQASYQGARVTTELQTTVDNNSWLKFTTDANGQPLTGGMSQPEANMSVQTDASTSPFQTLGGGGGPTSPPIKPVQNAPVVATSAVYTVKRGDTMHKIAKWWYSDGNQWPKICQANPMRDCNNLQAGQTLTLP